MNSKKTMDHAAARRNHKNVLFYTIKALNEINEQSTQPWKDFDASDIEYYLESALRNVKKLREITGN